MIAPFLKKRKTNHARRNGCGWIGIDLQSKMIRFAKVRHTHGRRDLETAYSIDLSEYGVTLEEILQHNGLKDVFLEHKTELDCFGRTSVAAVLPTSLTRLHQLTFPRASHSELEMMIQSELQSTLDDPGIEMTSDFWRLQQETDDETVKVETVSLPTVYAESIVNAARSLKWKCRMIDSRPTALSRTQIDDGSRTTAILELGLDETTFVITKDQRPLYTRILRDCGIRRLVENIATQHQLTIKECQDLLERMGSSDELCAENAVPSSSVTQWFMQGLLTPSTSMMRQVIEQLKTTLEFSKYRLSLPEVESLKLTGFGPLIPNAISVLRNELEMPVDSWSLDPSRDKQTLSPWGVSVALSEVGLS